MTDQRPHVAVVIGTRPEAIKLAPVVLELQRQAEISTSVWVSGQHREMLDPILGAFQIEPSQDLDVLVHGQPLADLTARALTGIDRLLTREPCDAVLIQGDTTTAFAAALAAFYHQVPVAHVEAGLRTGNPMLPYPEEANRRLISTLAALHLAPTSSAATNLEREAVSPARIVVTGNTVVDALQWATAHASPPTDPALIAIEADQRPLVLFTLHRREAWAHGARDAARAVARIAAEADVLVVVPLHRNPIVRDAMTPVLKGAENIRLLEPLDYLPFCRLMARSTVILTDSGGIQEEAPSLGVPVLVLRDETERPEAIACGAAMLVGTDPERITTEARRVLHRGANVESRVNPYGDGRAAARTVAALLWFLGRGDRPDAFNPVAG